MNEPPEFVPPADRPKALPIDTSLAVLIDAVERIGPARVRNSGRNAFNHLRKSWLLHPVDSEMSFFRALTGEEEAAAAVILALKQQCYPGAERLNVQDHMHKAAIWAIIEAIARGYSDKGVPLPLIQVAKVGRPRVAVSVDFGSAMGGEPLWAHSPEPFHVVIHSDENGSFEVHRWNKELTAMAGENTDISKYFRALANKRNRILYASDQGILAVRFADEEILLRLERVKWMMVATIGILQTKNLQLLVVQALEALLMAIRRFEGEGYAYPEFAPPLE